ncbi:alkaline shock response membrane anchor protein AmaP [Pseudonocardiaceae bacterium YIM PH 21723]|nr:alkaline shock response membrane anchor protein AmaP [Pseudonocardiaceae bacterium YIM PH 21723]
MTTALNRPARLNRSLLALLAILLGGAAAFLVLAARGRIPNLDARAPLVPGQDLPPQWVLIVAVAAAIVVGLLCLRWLAAQLIPHAKPVTARWAIHNDTGGHTQLDTSGAAAPLAEEVAELPGVTGASATLGGRRSAPVLSLVIDTEPDADISSIRREIGSRLLPRLRGAVDLDELPTAIEFRVTSHTASRVS